MRDNTKTPLDRGPKGMDERTRSVESARRIVKASNLHGDTAPGNLPGRRPAHTAGVFLAGTFTPSVGARRFTSDIFHINQQALARFSPLRTVDDIGRFDLHGLSLRLWPENDKADTADLVERSAHTTDLGEGRADATDLVALNTQPFMFRTADELETVVRLMRSTPRDKLIGLFEFVSATLSGDASVHGLVNAVGEILRGNRTLDGRTYWGIHTFFADHEHIPKPKRGTDSIRIPYRYRLAVQDESTSPPSKGRVLAKYRDLVEHVENGPGVRVDLCFMVPWRWTRLIDWADVPERIRLDLINPQAVWRKPYHVHMGTVVLDTVLDGRAAFGGTTAAEVDALLFDPTRLTTGLHVSEDPMLIALSSIYAESHMRRMG